MKHLAIAGVAAGLLATAYLALPAIAAAPATPAYVTAAVSDTHRPKADTDRDGDRKPAEMMAFAQVKPGDKVVDVLPGGGYVTRLFSKIVGPTGHVYGVNPAAMADRMKAGIKAVAEDPAYSNTTALDITYTEFKLPEPVDMVWTSMNYHDLKNPGQFGADTAALNKAIFAALKPGGLYVINDHAAAAGSGVSATGTLHRIDEEVVKKEVLAAGFVLDGESNVLRNPADDHTGHSNDQSDKFFLRFRKPR